MTTGQLSVESVVAAVRHLERAAAALRCRPGSAEQSYGATLCRRLADLRFQLDQPGSHGRADADVIAAAHRVAAEVERYLIGRHLP